jgi:hypothetical protein
MPDLHFQVEKIAALERSLTPQLGIHVRIENRTREAIHSMLLRCPVRIEAGRRRYTPLEQGRLRDLFGEPERWGETVHSLLWTNATTVVPAFTESVVVEVPLPCTFDFDIAVAKYIASVEGGEVPLSILFSGAVFYDPGEGSFQIQQIPWDREASCRLSPGMWQELMDAFYPQTAWLRVSRESFERLRSYQVERGLATMQEALDGLMPKAEGVSR